MPIPTGKSAPNALMGSLYAGGVAFPITRGHSVNGEEADKGSMLVRDTFRLLKMATSWQYRRQSITKGTADVIVTDGFTGNVITHEASCHFWASSSSMALLAHGSADWLVRCPRRHRDAARSALSIARVAPDAQTHDYREYGAAPILPSTGCNDSTADDARAIWGASVLQTSRRWATVPAISRSRPARTASAA
jgi:glycerol-3-phosphate acyltransferase PlsX